MSGTTPIIELEHVSQIFKTKAGPVPAVSNVSPSAMRKNRRARSSSRPKGASSRPVVMRQPGRG